jgi:hypothetical protein
VIDRLGSRAPASIIRLPDLGFNARALHVSLGGEWDYNLQLKSKPGPPIRTGWLRAILLGHQRVAAGLGIGVPILVLASTTTDFSPSASVRTSPLSEFRRVCTISPCPLRTYASRRWTRSAGLSRRT